MSNEYKGYELRYYSKSEKHPNHDNKYQTFKARPYDDAEYWWAYSYDKENWKVIFRKKVMQKFKGTFKDVVDLIEEHNNKIEPKIIHW